MTSRSGFILMILCLIFFYFLKDIQFSYYPEAVNKVLSVKIEMEGAGPLQIEQLICTPIEEEILLLSGVDSFYSRSGREECEITILLDPHCDLNRFYLDLRDMIDRKSRQLPLSASKAVIRKSSSLNSPVYIFVPELADPDDPELWTEERIRKYLSGINGISEIHLSSSPSLDLNINFETQKLSSHEMTTIDLASAVSRNNCISSVILEDSTVLVMDHRLKNIDDFYHIPINSSLSLDKIASVSLNDSAATSISRLNGKRQCIAWIYKNGDVNTLELCRSLRKVLKLLPESLVLYDRGEMIETSLSDLFRILLISALAVILVTILILKKLKNALPVCLNIPFSIGGTLAVFTMASYEINILVLAALALCSGMIVDSGIIVLEQGYAKSVKSLRASLVSTQIVLVPFIFASPGLKLLCIPLIRALCICLSLSVLFIRLTMKEYKGTEMHMRDLDGQPIVTKLIIRNRKAFAILLVIICILSLYFLLNLEFSQEVSLKDDSFNFSVEFPAGSTKESIESQLKNLEAYLTVMAESEYYSSEYKDEKASFRIKVLNNVSRDTLEKNIALAMKDLPGFLYFEDRAVEESYTIRIKAYNRTLLYKEADKIIQYLGNELGHENLIMHFKKQQPLLYVETDKEFFPISGISPFMIAKSIGEQLAPPVLGKWIPGDGSVYDIRVFSPDERRLEITEFGNMSISGIGNYPLESLSEIKDRKDYGPIEHFDSLRGISFSINTSIREKQKIHRIVSKALENYKLPENVDIDHGMEHIKNKKRIRELIKLLAAALILLLLLLVFIFESFFLAFYLIVQIILCHLFTLSFLSLAGIKLSVPVFFALILNTGLAVNNGLIVFSRFSKKRPSLEEALKSMAGCKKTILSAALTTLTGFLPFLWAGESSEGLLKALSLTVGSAVLFSIILLWGGLFFFQSSMKSI